MAMNSDDDLTFTRDGGVPVQDFDLIRDFEIMDDNVIAPDTIVVRVWDNIASIRLPTQGRLIHDGPASLLHPQNCIDFDKGLWQKVSLEFEKTLRGKYRNQIGCYEIIFLDTELDLDALLHWYDKETATHPHNPDLYKNNSLSKKCVNAFSLVARMLKQGGADEFWGASSPKLLTWDAKDLACYCESINISITKGNTKQLVQRDQYHRVHVKDQNSGKA